MVTKDECIKALGHVNLSDRNGKAFEDGFKTLTKLVIEHFELVEKIESHSTLCLLVKENEELKTEIKKLKRMLETFK